MKIDDDDDDDDAHLLHDFTKGHESR